MNSKIRSLAVVGAAATMMLACAPKGAQTTPTSVQRNVVTAQELAVAGDADLHDALTRIRPAILRSRIGGGTTGVQALPVTVYLDGVQMVEGIDHLREIAARNIQEVRYLEPQQANARFGGTNGGGALMITTKK